MRVSLTWLLILKFIKLVDIYKLNWISTLIEKKEKVKENVIFSAFHLGR